MLFCACFCVCCFSSLFACAFSYSKPHGYHCLLVTPDVIGVNSFTFLFFTTVLAILGYLFVRLGSANPNKLYQAAGFTWEVYQKDSVAASFGGEGKRWLLCRGPSACGGGHVTGANIGMCCLSAANKYLVVYGLSDGPIITVCLMVPLSLIRTGCKVAWLLRERGGREIGRAHV